MSKRYLTRVERVSAYTELLEMEIVADSEEEAAQLAEDFAIGNDPQWPTVASYTVLERTDLRHEVKEVDVKRPDAA